MQEYYSNTTNDKYTYGYIILPYTPTVNKPITNQKAKTNLMGKLKSGLKKVLLYWVKYAFSSYLVVN